MTPGGPGTELMDGIESADSDLFSTRIGGLSPVNGTDVPTLLRNLGAKTVVIAVCPPTSRSRTRRSTASTSGSTW